MRRIPQPVLLIGTLLFVASIIVMPLACSVNQRQTTIRTSVVSLVAAREAFVAWDGPHQQDIVKAATSDEDAKAKIAAYRERRMAIMTSFAVTFEGLALASTQTDDPSLKSALAHASDVVAILKLMGVAL